MNKTFQFYSFSYILGTNFKKKICSKIKNKIKSDSHKYYCLVGKYIKTSAFQVAIKLNLTKATK